MRSRRLLPIEESMSRQLGASALKFSALCAIVLTSGCSYVKGFYGGSDSEKKTTSVSSAVPFYAPQRYYAGDISAARVYVSSQLPVNQRMVLLDVRDATEYRMGHPEGAYHVPYPRLYQECLPHPSGAPEAQVRSDDGSICRFGAVPDSQVVVNAQDFWRSVQEILPYKDAAVAVLCRTGACAADVANLLAKPETVLGKAFAGQGYKEVYAIKEGFVGEPIAARDVTSGKLLSTDKKGETFKPEGGKQAFYAVNSVALDVNKDGKLTQADWGGWRNFLGLPYVMSMQPNLLSPAAQNYYDKP